MDWLPSLSFPLLSMAQLLQRLVASLLVVAVHGFAVAVLAERLGDPGPRHDGRKSLSPLAHLDLVGIAHGMFFRVVWMPKVVTDASALKGGWVGALAVTLGASVVLGLLSAALLALRPVALGILRDSAALTASGLLSTASDVAIVAAVVHMVPLPPFVGFAWAPWARSGDGPWHRPWVRVVAVSALVIASLAGWTGQIVGPLIAGWRSLIGF